MRYRGALLHLFTNCKSDTKNTQNTLATAYQRPGNHPQHPGILAMSSARSNLMLFHKKSSLTRNWTTSFERHWHKWISSSWFYAPFLLLTYVTDIISLNVSPICGIFHLVPTCQKSNRFKKELPQNNKFLLTSKSWFGNISKFLRPYSPIIDTIVINKVMLVKQTFCPSFGRFLHYNHHFQSLKSNCAHGHVADIVLLFKILLLFSKLPRGVVFGADWPIDLHITKVTELMDKREKQGK